ncbi:MAG: ABC transporter permease subunit, partial [candidate division Zixibacteria bacterium]|nr:ABC transporter permease subunit [candidate division Zixibacteria bacterium]
MGRIIVIPDRIVTITGGGRPFLTLFRWRMLQNIRGYKLLLAVLASIVIGIGHGYIDGSRFHQISEEHSTILRSERERIGRARTYATALPAVVTKLEAQTIVAGSPVDMMGGAALIRGIFGGPIYYNPYSLNNPFLYFRISGGFAGSLVMLLGLFALSLTYNSASMDRRIGQVRLLLSFGISRRDYLLSEWSAAVFTMMIPLLIAMAVFLVTTASVGASISALSVTVIGTLLLTLLTISIFAWVGLWLSASSETSRGALTMAIVFWAAVSWIWPWIASETAQFAFPISNRISFRAEGPSYADSLFIAAIPTTPPPGVSGWSNEYTRQVAEGYLGRQTLSGDQRNALSRQLSLFEKLSVFSPVTISQLSLASVSGVAGYGARRFLEYCQTVNQYVRNWQSERMTANPLR